LRRVHGVTLRDKVRSCDIRRALNVELLLRIERSQLRWFAHVSRMTQERLARHVLLAKLTGKRPRGKPVAKMSQQGRPKITTGRHISTIECWMYAYTGVKTWDGGADFKQRAGQHWLPGSRRPCPEVIQGPGGVTTSPTLLGTVLV